MAGKKSSNELTTEEIKRVMDDLKEMGIWAFDIVGGEPFVKPDIFEVLSYGKEIGLQLMINTNGTLVDRRIIEKLKEANPTVMVGVSLEGATQELNDFVRGKGSFEKAIRGIKLFVEGGFDPVILHVINKMNWRHFEKMIDLAKKLGVKKIYVDRFIPVGRGVQSKKYLDMDDREWVAAIEHVRDVINKYKDEITFYIEENITGDPCTAGRSHASILVDGNVVPCGHFRYNKELYMGNIREKPFSEIWNSYDPEKSLPLPEVCSDCPFVKSCYGGCKAVSLHRYGSFEKQDIPLCYIRRKEKGFSLKSWGW
ncbi:MAG: radical SAM protein [Thermotogaceae bacterium]|nr:radical SAM protein [Thermotogaceae bacterium]